jgi:hypothetical protein
MFCTFARNGSHPPTAKKAAHQLRNGHLERLASISLTKRGETWHTHFFVDGQRVRQSLQTSDWREAQAKDTELTASKKRGLGHKSQHKAGTEGYTSAGSG